MKKKLETELVSIAHKILELKDRSTLPQLQEEARKLYEKLSVLNFIESHTNDVQSTIGQIKNALNQENIAEIQEEHVIVKKTKPVIDLQEDVSFEKGFEEQPHQENEVFESSIEEVEEQKPEIVIEKINEKISENLFVPVPESTDENISLRGPIYQKNEKEIETTSENESISNPIIEEKPKSLNDQLKKGINIGLNDRLAFIKHLFDGSSADYNRVLSQLNTLNSKSGARQFILNMVKPDYKNWEGKSEYEERFIDIVTNKYEF